MYNRKPEKVKQRGISCISTIQLQRSSEGEDLTVTLCLVACGWQVLVLCTERINSTQCFLSENSDS